MRYTRQALKQDRFAETAADAMHWTVEHRSKLVNGGIALAVLLLVVIGGLWYSYHRESVASEELGHALLTYEAPLRPASIPADPQITSFTSIAERAQAAGKEFNEIAAKYGSTRSGKFAKYFAGLAAADAGNFKVAEEHLKYAAGVRNDDVASLSKLALAAVYREQGRDTDAVNVYKQLIEHPTKSVPKVTAQMQLAELYSVKQPNDARAIYQQIVKDDAKSAAAELATTKMQELK